MDIDFHLKSVQLLERLANSIYERDSKNPNLVCFSANEVQVVKEWIKDLIKELEQK